MEAYATWLPVIAALVAAGVAGGFIAGLLGVGGGIVLVPALDFALQAAGVSPAVALHMSRSPRRWRRSFPRPSRRPARMPRAAPSILRSAKRWSVPIVVGAFAGSMIASRLDAQALAIVFAVVALLAAAQDAAAHRPRRAARGLPAGRGRRADPGGHRRGVVDDGHRRRYAQRADDDAVRRARAQGRGHGGAARPVDRRAGDAGLPAGAARRTRRCRPWTIGYVSLPGLALIAPITWAVAPLGARLAHSLDRRKLTAAFGVFLFVVALRMLYRAWH